MADGEPVWIFASYGLERVDQLELVVAIRQSGTPDDEAVSTMPFELFRFVYQLANEGTPVTAGRGLELTWDGPKHDEAVGGCVFLPYDLSNPRLPEIDLAGYQHVPLLAIPLWRGEIAVAEQFGLARVLALLTKQQRCMPYPWWFDWRRPPVANPEAHEEVSVLAGLRRSHVPYLAVTRTGTHIDVELDDADCPHLLERLVRAGTDPLVLLTGMTTTTAESRCVWEPGQEHHVTMTGTDGPEPPVTSVQPTAGNFLLLAHGELDAKAGQLEDGYVVVLPTPLWQRFVAAVAAGEDITLRTGDGGGVDEVSLRVRPDGLLKVSPTADAWQPIERPLRNIEFDCIVLISAQYVLEKELSVEQLAFYLDEASLVVDDTLEEVDHRCEEMTVEFLLAPAQPPHVTLTIRPPTSGTLPEDVAQDIVARLMAMPAPAVRTDEARFQIKLRVR